MLAQPMSPHSPCRQPLTCYHRCTQRTIPPRASTSCCGGWRLSTAAQPRGVSTTLVNVRLSPTPTGHALPTLSVSSMSHPRHPPSTLHHRCRCRSRNGGCDATSPHASPHAQPPTYHGCRTLIVPHVDGAATASQLAEKAARAGGDEWTGRVRCESHSQSQSGSEAEGAEGGTVAVR